MPIPVVVQSKAQVRGRSNTEITGSNPVVGMNVQALVFMFSSYRPLRRADTRSEESYPEWCF